MKLFWKSSFVAGIIGFLFVSSSVFWTWHNYDHQATEPAQCAVVFGAAVWRDDIPSHALYDRTATGIQLYQADQVECLIFSGGASKSGAHEVDVMKKLALEAQIPDSDLILDYEGANTIATIKNISPEIKNLILVSNDFHLGRIRLLGWKFLNQPFQLKASEYHYGRYTKEKYFFWREVLGTMWYSLFTW